MSVCYTLWKEMDRMCDLWVIIVLGIAASMVTSIFTIAAAMLSSRISQAENLTEQYEPIEGG
jgi:hypothetical protein